MTEKYISISMYILLITIFRNVRQSKNSFIFQIAAKIIEHTHKVQVAFSRSAIKF